MFHLGGKPEVKKILISALVVAMCAGISATAFAVSPASVDVQAVDAYSVAARYWMSFRIPAAVTSGPAPGPITTSGSAR